MSTVVDIGPFVRRAFDRAHKLLAPDPESPPDLAAYAAFWLRSRCDVHGSSFLSPIVMGGRARELVQDVDLPGLSTQGFRLGAGLLRLDEATAPRLKVAVERVSRRKPHTEELSGPADDSLCLLGLWLLSSVVAPATASLFESWIDLDSLSPTLRAAWLLSGVAAASHALKLDTTSPQSLAAHLLVSSAASRPQVHLQSGVARSHIVSQLVMLDVDTTLSRGQFDALAVLVALEMNLQDGERVENVEARTQPTLDPAPARCDSQGRILTLDEAESRGLIRELARTITNGEQAAGVLTKIGVPIERIPTFANFPTPFDFWRRVCIELANGIVSDGLAALIAAVGSMYPGNARFNPTMASAPSSGDASPFTPPGAAAVGRDTAPRDASVLQPSSSSRFVAAGQRVAILLVCANPRGTDALRLGEEERALREALRLATHRDWFTITVLNAATIDDLRRALLRDSYGIVQFSGHATHNGLRFEDAGDIVEPDSEALAELLQRRGVQTVVLNACDSLGVGLAATAKIEHTIAMDGPIWDASAIEFSRGFYDALGEGLDVAGAFDEGVSCCKLKRLPVKAVLLRRGERPAS